MARATSVDLPPSTGSDIAASGPSGASAPPGFGGRLVAPAAPRRPRPARALPMAARAAAAARPDSGRHPGFMHPVRCLVACRMQPSVRIGRGRPRACRTTDQGQTAESLDDQRVGDGRLFGDRVSAPRSGLGLRQPRLVVDEQRAERLARARPGRPLSCAGSLPRRDRSGCPSGPGRRPAASSRGRSAGRRALTRSRSRGEGTIDSPPRPRAGGAGSSIDPRIAPWATISRRNRSRAEPSAIVRRHSSRASSIVAGEPAQKTISAASSIERSTRSVGPFASQAFDALGDLDRVSHGAAERLVHPRDQGDAPTCPGPGRSRTSPRQGPRVIELAP